MPISEERALDILLDLIRKPESSAQDIPRIWNEMITVYNQAFAPAPVAPAKKKRRRPANPNIGWPAGVSREEYKGWKAGQEKKGVTEGLNPQEYKRQRDAGLIAAPARAAKPEPKAAADAGEKKAKKSAK